AGGGVRHRATHAWTSVTQRSSQRSSASQASRHSVKLSWHRVVHFCTPSSTACSLGSDRCRSGRLATAKLDASPSRSIPTAERRCISTIDGHPRGALNSLFHQERPVGQSF